MGRAYNNRTDAIVFPAVNYKTWYDNVFCFWWYPFFDQNDGLDHYVFQTQMHFGWGLLEFGKFADNTIGGGIIYAGNRYTSVYSDYTLRQNEWNSIIFPYGGSGGEFWLNGEKIATVGGGINPYGGYSLTLGNNLAKNASCGGALAEFAMVGRWFLQGGFTAYSRGILPISIIIDQVGSQYGVEHYMPLHGIFDPEPDLIANTQPGVLFGTTKFGSHPPVQPYSLRWWRNTVGESEPQEPPPPPIQGGIIGTIVVPDEGEVIAQQIICGVAQPEDLWLRLFVNDYVPNELTTRTSFVEPDGYNYAPSSLTQDVDWTFEAGTPTPSKAVSWSRTFEISGPIGTVYGYYVEGKTSQKIYWAVRFNYPMPVGNSGGNVIVAPIISATSE